MEEWNPSLHHYGLEREPSSITKSFNVKSKAMRFSSVQGIFIAILPLKFCVQPWFDSPDGQPTVYIY